MTQLLLDGSSTESGADISDCGLYRFKLWRRWCAGTVCLWIMLNPSTAGAHINDPTIKRCISFASAWGHGAIDVVNLFPFRATKPSHLFEWLNDHPRLPFAPSDVAARNEAAIITSARGAQTIVVAWGSQRSIIFDCQAVRVVDGLKGRGLPLWSLGATASGHPRHPLYVRQSMPLERFEP